MSSWIEEMGVCWSQVEMPVRRRFEGGICGVEFPGEWMPSSNLMSSVNAPEAMEERGEPGESAMVNKEHC
jgi:hypothetical protein